MNSCQSIQKSRGEVFMPKNKGIMFVLMQNGSFLVLIFGLLNSLILNQLQSYQQLIQIHFFKHIIIRIIGMTDIFGQVSSRVRVGQEYCNIYQQQSLKFDLATYKIHNITCQKMIRLYQNIGKKYKITKELKVNQNSWNENERRLFCWFIICYTYLKQKDQSFSHLQLIYDESFWNQLSIVFFDKKPQLLQFQYLNMIKAKKRQAWTQQEDYYLTEVLKQCNDGRWNQVAKSLYYSSNKACFRTPKQCRQRWLNHLDSNKRKGNWKLEQDFKIFKYVAEHGKHWSKIIPILGYHRTEHMIKNRYNSVVAKFSSNNKRSQSNITQAILNKLQKQANLEKLSLQQTFSDQNFEGIQTPKDEEYQIQKDNQMQIPQVIMNEYLYPSLIQQPSYIDFNNYPSLSFDGLLQPMYYPWVLPTNFGWTPYNSSILI